MRGTYSVAALVSGVTAAQTLIQLKSGANNGLEILRASITNASVTADDTSEAQLIRKTVAATVTSATPVLFHPNDQAAKAVGGTAATGTDASAEGTDGAIPVHEGFSVLAGWVHLPTPEERVYVPPAGIIGLKLARAITSADLVAFIVFREIG